jgi:simple sugar transport system ATP-binding protein
MSETPILKVQGVSKRFGGVHALENVSLELYPGEVLALAGDNGAGKSTLIKIISGVLHPDEGTLWYSGSEVTFENPQKAREHGIETIYQDLALADNLDVGANVFLGREPLKRVLGFPVLDRKLMRTQAAGALRVLDIQIHRFDLPIRSLSGGQRQAVAIGRAIHWKAKILIMDEPTAALGVPEQRKVIALIKSLKQSGVGVIFISHNLVDIFAVSDRIVVLRRGVKAGERLSTDTSSDEIVRLMVGG